MTRNRRPGPRGRSSGEPEEARTRPMGAGDLAGDGRERAPGLAVPLEPVFANRHTMSPATPFPDQPAARLRPGNARPPDVTVLYEGSREGREPAFRGGAEPSLDPLLDLPGDTQDQKLAGDPLRGCRTIEPSPLGTQTRNVHLLQRPEPGSHRAPHRVRLPSCRFRQFRDRGAAFAAGKPGRSIRFGAATRGRRAFGFRLNLPWRVPSVARAGPMRALSPPEARTVWMSGPGRRSKESGSSPRKHSDALLRRQVQWFLDVF